MIKTLTYFLIDLSDFPPGWSQKEIHQATMAVKGRIGKQYSRENAEITRFRSTGLTVYDEEGEIVTSPVKSIYRCTLRKIDITKELVSQEIADELGFIVDVVMNKILLTVFDDLAHVHRFLKENAVEWGEIVG